ncbi:hypothetical protein OIO89_01210 (plasmid) [Mycobacterium ulcerans]|nr:hypothetical protein OIO89_01210 [Mycobacterium ulcerans]
MLSLQDAATLVTSRGRLMQSCTPGGTMLALQASEAEVQPLLEGLDHAVSIAAINGATSIVLSEITTASNKSASTSLPKIDVPPDCRSVTLSTLHMDPILEQFRQIAAQLTFTAPTCPSCPTSPGRSPPRPNRLT